jgi:hypothetical protein
VLANLGFSIPIETLMWKIADVGVRSWSDSATCCSMEQESLYVRVLSSVKTTLSLEQTSFEDAKTASTTPLPHKLLRSTWFLHVMLS